MGALNGWHKFFAEKPQRSREEAERKQRDLLRRSRGQQREPARARTQRLGMHYAAERRLYQSQLSRLRREWIAADLSARRAAYVESRTAQRAQAGASRTNLAAASERDEPHVARESASAARAQARVSEERAAIREAAEADFRRQWMSRLLQKQDSADKSSRFKLLDGPADSRTWITPENFEKRISNKILRLSGSPIDKWEGVMRDVARTDEEAHSSWQRLEPIHLEPLLTAVATASVGDGASAAAGAAPLDGAASAPAASEQGRAAEPLLDELAQAMKPFKDGKGSAPAAAGATKEE